MKARLDRGEYWLLPNAVEHALSLRILTLPEWPQVDPKVTTIDVVLNKRGHGLDRDQLAQTLSRMTARGRIELSRDVRRQTTLHMAREEMRCVLDETGRFDEGVYYFLTPQGGDVWESFARPEWDRYVSYGQYDDEPATTEVIASSEKSLARFMTSMSHEASVEAGSEIRDEVRPWQATYWKTLPIGFRCRFRASQPPSSGAIPVPFVPSTDWLRSRWCPWL